MINHYNDNPQAPLGLTGGRQKLNLGSFLKSR